MSRRSGDWENLTPQQKADSFDAQIEHSKRMAEERERQRLIKVAEGQAARDKAAAKADKKGKHRA